MTAAKEPPSRTLSGELLRLVREYPGVSTRELVKLTGYKPTGGNMAYVNSCLNHLHRRGFIENRAKPKQLGLWWPLEVDEVPS